MRSGKTLLDCTNLFSRNYYRRNDKIIYNHFKNKYAQKNASLVFRIKNS